MVGVWFYLKRDIHRYILNIKPFSRDICGHGKMSVDRVDRNGWGLELKILDRA